MTHRETNLKPQFTNRGLIVKKTRIREFAALLAAAITLASGCGRDDGSQAPDKPPGQVVAESEAEQPSELSAAHILIMYKGSERAEADVVRSKEEALALAQEVAEKAKAEDADFAALAKEYSDGPSGPRGGSLGNFRPEQMVNLFSEAAMKLPIGGVSDTVETPFGYHIIRRQEIQVILKASAKHVLVQYAGSMQAAASITRTKEEALARAQECLERARAGDQFEDLAREYSDGPSGPRGGELGEFPQGAMAPAFDDAVFACEVGKVTDIVETPFGYHIIYRYK